MTRGVAAAALVALALAAPARGDGFTPLPLPPGATTARDINGFAASGSSWLALVSSGVRLSTDSGATWRTVDTNGSPSGLISVAPDGAFWLPQGGGIGTIGSLARISQDGNSVTNQSLPRGTNSPPAWDPQGRMWVAGITGGTQNATLNVVRVDASGAEAQRLSMPAGGLGLTFMRFVGSDGYIGTEGEIYLLRAGKLSLISGHAQAHTDFVSDMLWPVDQVGGALLAFFGISTDGGASFSRTTRQQMGVWGEPRMLVRYPLVGQDLNGAVMTPCNSWVFCETGLAVPPNTGAVWKTQAGLVAVSLDADSPLGPIPATNDDGVFAIHRGALPPPVAGPGATPTGSRALIAGLNRYRRDAGLPPLVFDPAISRAALNHARYAVQHNVSLSDPIRAHAETPGTAGFTGKDPAARCKAVGWHCDAEDMVGGGDAVDVLISSYYHRLVAMAPFTQFAGAARYKNVTVFDFDAARGAIPLRPSGFPAGNYRGPLGMIGREVPNPLDICQRFFPVTVKHPSVPITFEPPGREPSRPRNLGIEIREGPDVDVVEVQLFQGRKRIHGCGKRIGGFIAGNPLRAHTRYTAKALWKPSPSAPLQTYSWTFKTR